MTTNFPKLSVIIPTRERSDTLLHTLKTVVDQDYNNLEIIVSDNASEDQTKLVVESYKDARIRYINTQSRIGMSENWEFALSHVTGDFVMYLGDDDGLLPKACSDVAKIINYTKTRALIWNKSTYNWPSNLLAPNLLSFQCAYDLCEMRGEIMLKGVSSGKTGYGRLPLLYSGFVSVDVINVVKNKTGTFFQSITPDVYSGIVLADELPTYLYSFRPFSINGGSNHSNGIATFTNNDLARRFFNENALPINTQIPIISGSIQSHIAESFLQAQNYGLLKKYRLNVNKIHYNIFKEVIVLDPTLRQNGLQILFSLDLNKNNRKLVEKELIFDKEKESIKIPNDANQLFFYSNSANGIISFDTEKLSLHNSYDVCKFLGNILGDYLMPSHIIKANYITFIILYLKRFFSKVFSRYQLPL
jgi:glycosyltransferase involved in cell wall biosynthesis